MRLSQTPAWRNTTAGPVPSSTPVNWALPLGIEKLRMAGSVSRFGEGEIHAVAPLAADMERAFGAAGLAEAKARQQAQAPFVARVHLGADLLVPALAKGPLDHRLQRFARIALAPDRGREQEADLVAVPQARFADQQAILFHEEIVTLASIDGINGLYNP